MARAYSHHDYAEPAYDPRTGDWQALRGELVALLDQVEHRYSRGAGDAGLSQRVRQLRDQVEAPEPAALRRQALHTVKRAVDRFNIRPEDEGDDLTAAIAEIRSRQGAREPQRQAATAMPEFRELSALIGGMSDRLGHLEGELKTQRGNSGQVREVAGQVEQLTQVVELLAGAVGETGQVKRLEAQIGALASMIERGPKVDLGTVNARLDDVSATVAKLAELQAEQMERELLREERSDAAKAIGPSTGMDAVEAGVRVVYDRIDAIERTLALSSSDFERLTNEMAAFTRAMQDSRGAPELLVGKVDALAKQLEGLDSPDTDVMALKGEIVSLQTAVLSSIEPRFARLETQIEELSHKVTAPTLDTSVVEGQLKQLMKRMDDAGAQLDGLARLYHDASDRPDFEALATLVAERASDAVTRKLPAPIAMFGPDSLKSVEARITSLVKSAGGPDVEELAARVAEVTSETLVRSGATGVSAESLAGFETRMSALLNTAGKDTAERLARVEAALAARQGAAAPMVSEALLVPTPETPRNERRQAAAPEAVDPFAAALEAGPSPLDAILARLDPDADRDIMPNNPGDDAPLVDRGFPAQPARTTAEAGSTSARIEQLLGQGDRPNFDPSSVERPPRPQSAFSAERESFAPPPVKPAAPSVEASSTSTFVAAARRVQRSRQEDAAPEATNSLIGRALARVRAPQAETAPAQAKVEEPVAEAKPAKAARQRVAKEQTETVAPDDEAAQGFISRHRRPLLLAAAVVAVSMLTLNLAMQRMQAPQDSTPELASEAATMDAAPPPAVVPEAEEVSEVAPSSTEPVIDTSTVPPRVIEMVDPTATGSINPGAPMAFSRSADLVSMPSALRALSPEAGAETGTADNLDGLTVGSVPEQFDLPPAEAGPEGLRQAAAAGDAKAQFEVAAVFTEGRSVAQDLEEAAKWYERAAAQGFVPAQYRLGNLYEAGTGVAQDFDQAKLWYQRAADAGNRMAMHNLAALYASGQLGEQQFEDAADWFSKAAALGMTDSQFNLGMLYARGLGVEQDFEQSYKWFSLAARGGDAAAAQSKSDIAKSMSAEAVSRVDAEVAGWVGEAIPLAANFAPIGTWAEEFDPGQTIADREVVSRVQSVLNRLGFEVGTADGVAGPKTSEAIKAFERGTGMSESGQINPRLLAVLGSQPV